jgi:hypothetical protein
VSATVGRKGRGASDFECVTPTVTTSVRGTVFKVSYHSGATTISVTTDTVYVQPTSRGLHSLFLKAGHKVTVTHTRIGPVTRTG